MVETPHTLGKMFDDMIKVTQTKNKVRLESRVRS